MYSERSLALLANVHPHGGHCECVFYLRAWIFIRDTVYHHVVLVMKINERGSERSISTRALPQLVALATFAAFTWDNTSGGKGELVVLSIAASRRLPGPRPLSPNLGKVAPSRSQSALPAKPPIGNEVAVQTKNRPKWPRSSLR